MRRSASPIRGCVNLRLVATARREQRLNLPPQLLKALSSFGNANPQQIFNNTAGIPAPVLDAIRTGLAVTIDHMFLIGLFPILLAVVVTLFMPDVPLKKTRDAMLGEPAPVPIEAAEPEPA